MTRTPEPDTQPTLAARWLSPGGYLGLHLVCGFLLALAMGAFFNFIKDRVMEAPATLRADIWAHELAFRTQSPGLTRVVATLTLIGNTETLTVLTILVLIALAFRHSRRRLYAFLFTMTGGALLNVLLKTHYQRPRPSAFPHLVEAGGYSFPSGHSMGSMLFFGILAYVVYFSFDGRRIWRMAAVAACVVMVLVVGTSRIYLGVHYLSDVAAGFAGGLFWIGVVVTGTETWVKLRDWRFGPPVAPADP